MVRSIVLLTACAACSCKDFEAEPSCLLQQALQNSGRLAGEADDELAMAEANENSKSWNQQTIPASSNAFSQIVWGDQQPTEEEAKQASAFAAEERMREQQQDAIRDAQKREQALIALQRQLQFEEHAGTVAKKPEDGEPRVEGISAVVASSAPTASSAMEATQQSAALQLAGAFPKVPPVMLQKEATLAPRSHDAQHQADQASEPQAALMSTAKAVAMEVRSCQPGVSTWPACAHTSAYGPQHSSCTPQCTWQCDTPKCDEVCEPICEPPRCETRCATADTSHCVMECNEPHCAVTCNRNACPSGGCPSCISSCSEPMCKLRCPSTQPCRNVCEVPSCEWHCRAPDVCPEPTCHMVCESPPSCQGDTYQQLPPLNPGEMSVRSFAAPSTGEGYIHNSVQEYAPSFTGSRMQWPDQSSPPYSEDAPVQFAPASHPRAESTPSLDASAIPSPPNLPASFGTGVANPDRWDEYLDRFAPHHDPEYGQHDEQIVEASAGDQEELQAEADLAEAAEAVEASLFREPGSFSKALLADPEVAEALQANAPHYNAAFSQPSPVWVKTETHSLGSSAGEMSLHHRMVSLPVIPPQRRP